MLGINISEHIKGGQAMNHIDCINYLKDLPGETISPAQLAKVLGGKPYLYNLSAKDGSLTLPYIWRGRNLRIFKQPLIDLISGKAA